MKKSLLLLMATSLMALTGCSDDSTSEPTPTIELSEIQGTYNMDFFASAAGKTGGASSDWNKLGQHNSGITKPTMQDAVADAHGNFIGKVTVNNKNGKIAVISKLQMKDNSFTTGSYSSVLKPQQYNYTVYTEVSNPVISGNTITIKGVGVTGRNGTTKKGTKNASDDFSFTFVKHANGNITATSKSTDNSSIMKADVFLALTKKKDTVDALDANTQLKCDKDFNTTCTDVALDGQTFKDTPDEAPKAN